MLNTDLINLIVWKFGVERAISYLEIQIYVLEQVKLRGLWLSASDDYDLSYYKDKYKELTTKTTVHEY